VSAVWPRRSVEREVEIQMGKHDKSDKSNADKLREELKEADKKIQPKDKLKEIIERTEGGEGRGSDRGN
jgi:hypothetical protein